MSSSEPAEDVLARSTKSRMWQLGSRTSTSVLRCLTTPGEVRLCENDRALTCATDQSRREAFVGEAVVADRAPDAGATNRSSQHRLRAIATYASCGKVNRPPSNIAGVAKAIVLDATDEMTACRSGSTLSFSKAVIGVASS
jgi:hypothetical protein